MESSLPFKSQILRKCRITMLTLCKTIKICKSLPEEASSTSLLGLEISHLDYNNVVLIGLPRWDINRMQRVQSFAAKAVSHDR